MNIVASLNRLRAAAVLGTELPEGRFFTPTPTFWAYISRIYAHGTRLIDCGTGNGHLLDEAAERGFDLKGVDLCYRADQSKRVEMRSALDITEWGRECWPLICRPSHDGWANEVADKARAAGAHVLWVTKPESYQVDLLCYGPHARRVIGVFGQSGERMYSIGPRRTK